MNEEGFTKRCVRYRMDVRALCGVAVRSLCCRFLAHHYGLVSILEDEVACFDGGGNVGLTTKYVRVSKTQQRDVVWYFEVVRAPVVAHTSSVDCLW